MLLSMIVALRQNIVCSLLAVVPKRKFAAWCLAVISRFCVANLSSDTRFEQEQCELKQIKLCLLLPGIFIAAVLSIMRWLMTFL